MVIQRARESIAAFAFCALVGGQDELVFDGHSLVVDHSGAVIARAAQFAEEILICDVDLSRRRRAPPQLRPARAARRGPPAVELLASLPMPAPPRQPPRRGSRRCSSRSRPRSTPHCAWDCATTSPRMASATSCSPLWRDRLGAGRRHRGGRAGAERVSVIVMPRSSPRMPRRGTRARSPRRSRATDRAADRRRLRGLRERSRRAVRGPPAEPRRGEPAARIRGNLLMALSNKFGWLVLTTGNKSEMSVGYSTLYGTLPAASR